MNAVTIGLIITYRCNAACEMCCNDSGPHRTEDMSSDDAMKYIKQANDLGIKRACITGGEPFLFFDKLTEIARYCRKMEIFLGSLTNAYWAITEPVANEKLKQAKNYGLSEIVVSTSDYHRNFIPLERVRNCINAALCNDMLLELRVLVGTNTKKLKDYVDELGISLSENKISVREYPLSPVGRGISLDPMGFKYNATDCNCTSIFRQPVIEPSGDLYVCCGVGYKNKQLLLGNLKQEDLASLLQKAKDEPLYNAISMFGPFSIARMVAEDGNNNLEFNEKKFTDICHACNQLLNNERNFEIVSKTIDKRAKEILGLSKVLSLDLQK